LKHESQDGRQNVVIVRNFFLLSCPERKYFCIIRDTKIEIVKNVARKGEGERENERYMNEIASQTNMQQ